MFATRIKLLAAAGFAVGLLGHGSVLAANCESLSKSTSIDAYVRLHQDAQGINAARDAKPPSAGQAGKDVRAEADQPLPMPVATTREAGTAKRAYAGGGRRLSGVLSY